MDPISTTPGVARRRWRKPLVLVGLTLMVALVAGYLYASAVVYDTLSVTHAKCGGRFVDDTPATFRTDGEDSIPHVDSTPYLMPEYETETLPSRDPGIDISAWYIPSDRGVKGPAVVMVHGHDSCKREPRMLLAAGMLHKDGIAVLMIDMRNHGDSTVVNGRYAGGTREYQDALGGWDWLVQRGFAPNHVGMLGMSLGAATALIATGEEPGVAAVWEDSSYADVDVTVQAELARHGFPSFLRFGGYILARLESGDDLLGLSPIKAVAKLDRRPIFIVHGTADERLSVRYASDLANAVRGSGGTVDPWVVDGATHTGSILLHPGEYERRLDGFFEAALGQP